MRRRKAAHHHLLRLENTMLKTYKCRICGERFKEIRMGSSIPICRKHAWRSFGRGWGYGGRRMIAVLPLPDAARCRSMNTACADLEIVILELEKEINGRNRT